MLCFRHGLQNHLPYFHGRFLACHHEWPSAINNIDLYKWLVNLLLTSFLLAKLLVQMWCLLGSTDLFIASRLCSLSYYLSTYALANCVYLLIYLFIYSVRTTSFLLKNTVLFLLIWWTPVSANLRHHPFCCFWDCSLNT